jgi:putative ABC transport system permease protein
MIDPPKRVLSFLRWFCREDYIDEIEGDLTEVFNKDAERSPKRARLRFALSVLKHFRPGFIRSFQSTQPNSFDMFQSYFKIGWRNLLSQRLYSSINVGGLTVGLTCFILVSLYIQFELSYDKFHKNADRIYMIYQQQTGNVYMGSDVFALTPVRLAAIMRDELPEVESATSLFEQSALITFQDKNFLENGIAAESFFLQVFDFKILKGNPFSALSDPKSIIITKSFAEKIFGDEDPMGKVLKFRNDEILAVTAVVADPPSNSSLQFSYITNIMGSPFFAEDFNRPRWTGNSVKTFFLLREGADVADTENKFPSIIQRYRDADAYKGYPFKDRYIPTKLTSMHLSPAMNEDVGAKGNKIYLYLFAIVAFIVLLFACVNYMNLAIARSIRRAREVGLRKVVGAVKRQVIGQFLGESIIISFVSLVLAIGGSALLLPVFERLAGQKIGINLLTNPWLIIGLFITMLLVGVFSGSYPAFVMSSVKPIDVLRGKMTGRIAGFKLQRVLIVVQYAASIIMLVGSLVIYRQIEFMKNKDLGYKKDNIITVPIRDNVLADKYETLNNEWRQLPGVIATTVTKDLPTFILSNHIVRDEDGSGPEDDVIIYEWRVAGDFMSVFDLNLVAGEIFRDEKDDEKGLLMINETAAKALGWSPQQAVGKQFQDYERMNTIVGVVRDFHMHSMQLSIEPLIIRYSKSYVNHISVKVQPEHLKETILAVERSVSKLSPYPFDYQMLDDNFDQLYASENKLGEIFGSFTILAIVIASLGLFGLAAFTSSQRTKEVGIRKVLGASVRSVTVLLSKDFMKLVSIAFVISIPAAWYLANYWLQAFAYRTNVDWSVFAVAALLMVFVTNAAVAYQSIKAAVANPVNSLKAE